MTPAEKIDELKSEINASSVELSVCRCPIGRQCSACRARNVDIREWRRELAALEAEGSDDGPE